MAHKNEFLPFSNNATSNVIDQTSYESLDARKTGFSSGVAKSAQLNKVWRQSSIMASALGQFIADKNGVDILDDGDVPKLVAEMNKAISGGGTAGVKTFNGASGDITISQGNNITITKNGNDFKIAASGGTAGVTTLNNLSGAVNLVAGANVTITPNGNNLTIAASGGGGGAVTSVNGKTGAVNLTYTDVGATNQSWVQSQGYAQKTVANTWTQTQTFQGSAKTSKQIEVSGGGYVSDISPQAYQVGLNGWGLYNDGSQLNINCNNKGMAFTSVGNFTVPAEAYKPNGGVWASGCDRRLKTDIRPLTGALAKINALNPVTYERLYALGKKEAGFLADEVKPIIPSAVDETLPNESFDMDGNLIHTEWSEIIKIIGKDKPLETLGWKNDFFAYLVGAIKELTAKTEDLEAQIAAMQK